VIELGILLNKGERFMKEWFDKIVSMYNGDDEEDIQDLPEEHALNDIFLGFVLKEYRSFLGDEEYINFIEFMFTNTFNAEGKMEFAHDLINHIEQKYNVNIKDKVDEETSRKWNSMGRDRIVWGLIDEK
jgi:hypothetical protein